MKNNTFLMLGLLLSTGLSLFADGLLEEVTGSGSAPIEVTSTGKGPVSVHKEDLGPGALKIVAITIIQVCTGTCTQSTGPVGLNAVNDKSYTITDEQIKNALSLGLDLNNVLIELPFSPKTLIYSFNLASGPDKGKTVYVALTSSSLKRTMGDFTKNAPRGHDTLVTLSVNIDAEKGLSGKNKGKNLFTEKGSLTFDSSSFKNANIAHPSIPFVIQGDGMAKIEGIDVLLNLNRIPVSVK